MNSVKITKDTEKLTQFDTILSNGVQDHIFVCYTKCQNISQINDCLILKFSLESLVTLLNRLLKGFGKLTELFMYRTDIRKSFYEVKNKEVPTYLMFIFTEATKNNYRISANSFRTKNSVH